MSMKKMDRDNQFRPDGKLDDSLMNEIEEALGGKSIEELVDEEDKDKKQGSSAGGRSLVDGTVVAISGDDIFIDYGGRSEGLLPVEQFKTEEPLPEPGSKIKVHVDGFDRNAGLMRLSREGVATAVAWDSIEKGRVVEGMVSGHNKGGLEMKINGIKGFMPISQVDIGHVEDLSGYLNKKLQAIVTEVDRSGKRIVLSRRDLLDKLRAEKAVETWDSLHEGKVVSGTVRNIMPYGAFVDIGGVDGLLHIRDMAHGRVENPEDVVHEGQELEVRVLSIDPETRKIGLGLKQTQADPWETAEINYPVGTMVTGRVVKVMDFGAFVEIEEGVEGLVPVSEMSLRRIGHPREVVSAGDTVKMQVMSVDVAQQRMSLSIKQLEGDPWQGASVRWPEGSVIEGPVTRIADFGAFVELAPGVEGLVHISEIAPRHVSSVRAELDEGQVVKAAIIEVDEIQGRISLSIKKLSQPEEQDVQEGTMSDLQSVNQRSSDSNKNLKGGLGDTGGVSTPLGGFKNG